MKDITIRQDNDGLFYISQGNKTAEGLFWEETIGLLCSLTIEKGNPCQKWMKTKEQIEIEKNAVFPDMTI